MKLENKHNNYLRILRIDFGSFLQKLLGPFLLLKLNIYVSKSLNEGNELLSFFKFK